MLEYINLFFLILLYVSMFFVFWFFLQLPACGTLSILLLVFVMLNIH